MIIPSNDTRTIAEVFGVPDISKIYEANESIFNDLPFVEVGNVYASLCITGPDSWPTIVKHYANDNFILLGGRHGNVINPIGSNFRLDPNDLATDIGDASHVNNDKPNVESFNGRVKMIDVTKRPDLQSSAGLHSFCHAQAQAGKKVIFAWCYGIFTHIESQVVKHGEDVSNKKSLSFPQFSRLMRMPINQIVQTYW